MQIQQKNTFHILLVEDNEGDILLTREALEESSLNCKLDNVKDGQSAIDFIYNKNEFKSHKLPDLILLDINLPYKNGHEVLASLKNDGRTRQIPVIMFTTSSSEEDILKSYQLHANSYVTKPLGAEQFEEVFKNIENFWMQTSKLPNH